MEKTSRDGNTRPPYLLPEKPICRARSNSKNRTWNNQFSSVTQSCLTFCDPMDCSMPGFPVHHQLLELAQIHVHPAISSPIIPFSSCLQSFPASGSFPISQFFESDGQSIGASASASVLPKNIQDCFLLGLTGWICCSPKNSQESSPTPQFESMSSSVLSFLYGPTLTSIHDHWKNHIFD